MHYGQVLPSSIVIVDPAPDDYRELIDHAGQAFDVQLFSSGEQALRLAPPTQAVWLVNDQLPDVSGLELIHLLRPALRRSPVFLVADRYDPAAELAALSTGSVQFLIKPLSPDLLLRLQPATAVAAAPRRSRTAMLAAEAWEPAVTGV